MNNNNKIGNSPYKDFIEQQLRAGVAYRTLSKELKEMNFDVSHSTLAEYHKNNMGGVVSEPEEQEQFTAHYEAIEYRENADNVAILRRMFNRQLQIVDQRQAGFMAGRCRFPDQELKALKLFNDLLTANQIDRTNQKGEPETD